MEQCSKEWFELVDHRKRLFSRAVWIPVYGLENSITEGSYTDIGHVEELLNVSPTLYLLFGYCLYV